MNIAFVLSDLMSPMLSRYCDAFDARLLQGKFVSDRLTDSGRLVAVIPSGAKWVCSLVQENIKKSSICSSRSANSASSAGGTSTTSSHSSTSTVVPDRLASLSTGLKKGR